MKKIDNFSISCIKLNGFKSIEDVSINLNEGLNIIIGKNAVGKTNFINFLYNILNFNFAHFNNFKASFNLNHRKMVYNFTFSKKTTINNIELRNNELKFKSDFWDSKKFQPEFYGKLSFFDNRQNIDAEFVSEDEAQCSELFENNLKFDNIELNSIFIRHGLPKNYSIIDTPLNIELWNNLISDDFLLMYNSENQSKFFKKLLFSTLTMELLNGEYFNKKLKNKEAINKFIFQKKTEYKTKILSDLQYITELKYLLRDYSPIQDLRINDSFNIDIDVDSNKVTLRNFFFEYFVDDKWFLFDDLSDGTKRIFYIISEIFILDRDNQFKEGVEKLNVVFIEEPELGIHPHQLYNIMKFLKEKSRTMQIVITTHSPLSLNILEKNQLDSIIIADKRKGKTILKKLTKTKIEKARMYMNDLDLSDYWLNSDLED